MRRAEWRRRADDPTTLLGWWWRGVSGRRSLSLVFLLPLAASIWNLYLGGTWVFMFCSTFALCVTTIRPIKTVDRLRSLLPEPAPEGQFRAMVEYRRDGRVTGRDEMALTVVDGWLVGEGVRSNFALRSADVREARMWDERIEHRERLLLTDGAEIRLRGITFDAASKATLDRWRRSEAASGEPTFPPARVHPQVWAKGASWIVGGFAVNVFASGLKHLSPFFRGDVVQMALTILSLWTIYRGLQNVHHLWRIHTVAESEGESQALAGRVSVRPSEGNVVTKSHDVRLS